MAAVASAALEDGGLVTAEDSPNVIDQSKVRRVRIKTRGQLRVSEKPYCVTKEI